MESEETINTNDTHFPKMSVLVPKSLLMREHIGLWF